MDTLSSRTCFDLISDVVTSHLVPVIHLFAGKEDTIGSMTSRSNSEIGSIASLKNEDWRRIYEECTPPVTVLDCGRNCAPHNPSGKPFCCDICHAVPAVYRSEWNYLRGNTDLWHRYRGDECKGEMADGENPTLGLPGSMILLACLGPERCQREFRALSCRQFPFFPYVTSDFRFIGMACEWEFEDRCWVISHLSRVTQRYRTAFMKMHDHLFASFQDVFENYACHSEYLRIHFLSRRRRFTLLHRNGGYYLVSPKTERMEHVDPSLLRKFGPYRV